MTGQFVYRGAGKKQNKDADLSQHMCRKEACDIQWCLARRNHQESVCEGIIQKWKDCVKRYVKIGYLLLNDFSLSMKFKNLKMMIKKLQMCVYIYDIKKIRAKKIEEETKKKSQKDG